MKIKDIKAREILDSRGIPTVETSVLLDDGSMGVASVPSGSSAGEHEALELRDGDKDRYHGKGVLKAVHNVETEITDLLRGENALNQRSIDQKMVNADGTENKSKFGANAILSVSLATSKAAASSLKIPLYEYLKGLYENEGTWQKGLGVDDGGYKMPEIMSVIIEAGKHSTSNIEVQEFMIIPRGLNSFTDSLERVADIYHELKEVLLSKEKSANVGLEGAYGPDVSSNDEPMELILEATEKAGFKKEDLGIALDVAASEFYKDEDGGKYVLKSGNVNLSQGQMIGLLQEWKDKYPLVSIEDGLDENDWEGWKNLTEKLGDVLVVGDDLFVTNPERLNKGIKEGAGNALIIKPNQIGTLTETFQTIRLAKENKYKTIVSHRSGETNETFIADLSVAVSSDFIKTGAPSRGERLAKYNRLLEIEGEIKDSYTQFKKYFSYGE